MATSSSSQIASGVPVGGDFSVGFFVSDVSVSILAASSHYAISAFNMRC